MPSDSDLEQYKHIWDGSENWGLIQYNASLTKLEVHFVSDVPTVAEIIALRKLIPEYRNLPLKEIKLKLGSSGYLLLGTFSGHEAISIYYRGINLNLDMERHDVSTIYYQIIEQATETVLTIENKDLERRIAQTMLEHGIPIVGYVEVD